MLSKNWAEKIAAAVLKKTTQPLHTGAKKSLLHCNQPLKEF